MVSRVKLHRLLFSEKKELIPLQWRNLGVTNLTKESLLALATDRNQLLFGVLTRKLI